MHSKNSLKFELLDDAREPFCLARKTKNHAVRTSLLGPLSKAAGGLAFFCWRAQLGALPGRFVVTRFEQSASPPR